MAGGSGPTEFEVQSGGIALRGESDGDGSPIVLLHGLSAVRRYVVMGSRALPRAGWWTVAYDARGHGDSDAAPDAESYEYADLVGDLAAVLDGLEIERTALAGVSMGAHTVVRFALDHPQRVAGLVLITPAYDGDREGDGGSWLALADALDRDGVDGFLTEWGARDVAERWRDAALKNARQRLERHRNLHAVADALRVVPRSRAFDGIRALERVEAPALVVGSRDEADPVHPLAVADAYARRLPRRELVVEEEGKSPIAWQGARLSRRVAEFLGEARR
ncbi:MAG: alpha/beta fold hydrolase [Actinobacteria bacterium]|nr:alpha/beta fold hydrolase [Actinomycetota bacterium]